ncbi:MAG: glycosyltransferase, partial [Bryobacteraceae bacterium]
RKLCVVGDGPELRQLTRMATPNIEFRGRLDDAELRELYARCRAFLMPGEEDFGITAVEALASGKPVIALGKGGAAETVPTAQPVGGVLYRDSSDDGLQKAIEYWDMREKEVDPRALQAYATKFSETEFLRKIAPILFPPDSPLEDTGV